MAKVPIVSSFVICGILSVRSLDFDELFLCGSVEATENLQPSAVNDRQQVPEQEAPTAPLKGTGSGPTIPNEGKGNVYSANCSCHRGATSH